MRSQQFNSRTTEQNSKAAEQPQHDHTNATATVQLWGTYLIVGETGTINRGVRIVVVRPGKS